MQETKGDELAACACEYQFVLDLRQVENAFDVTEIM